MRLLPPCKREMMIDVTMRHVSRKLFDGLPRVVEGHLLIVQGHYQPVYLVEVTEASLVIITVYRHDNREDGEY